MLLIEEYVRLILEEEQSQNTPEITVAENPSYTYKELFDFFRFIKKGNNAKKALRFVGSVTGSSQIEDMLNMSGLTEEAASKVIETFCRKLNIPRGNPLRALAKFYGVNDLEGLKGIAIPSNVSNLIDDQVEEDFINDLLKDLKVKADQSPSETVDSEFVMNKLKAYTKDDNEKTRGSFASIR